MFLFDGLNVFATGVIKDPRDYAVFYNRTHWHAFSCHAMLRNGMCSYCSYHARMGWGVGWGGVGVVACVVLSHMLDATELHIHVSCYATACARTVRIMRGWGGGWGGGGVGVVACVVLSHMLDATELHIHVSCYATACARTVRIMRGWGGGGWAWLHALSCHTCWMLQNCTYMFHATQLHVLVLFVSCADGGGGGGRGCMRCLVTHVGCYRTAHTCFMLRNCMCSYCSYHARMGWGGVGVVACVVLSHMLVAQGLRANSSRSPRMVMMAMMIMMLMMMIWWWWWWWGWWWWWWWSLQSWQILQMLVNMWFLRPKHW